MGYINKREAKEIHIEKARLYIWSRAYVLAIESDGKYDPNAIADKALDDFELRFIRNQ